MAIKSSEALRDAMLDINDFKTLMAAYVVYIYEDDVAPPATPEEAVTATELWTVATLDWGTAANGAIPKGATAWTATPGANGVAAFFRICETGDAGDTSDPAKYRIQGLIDTSGADINLASTTLDTGTPLTINNYEQRLPQ